MSLETELFVYGTLRHNQPEHSRLCRGVTAWRKARMRGRLVILREGYLLMIVDPRAMLREATHDVEADEHHRSEMTRRGAANAIAAEAKDGWVEGELLAFADAARAWPPLDEWECYKPGAGGVYRRTIAVAEIMTHSGRWERRPIWAYLASQAPAGSRPVGPA